MVGWMGRWAGGQGGFGIFACLQQPQYPVHSTEYRGLRLEVSNGEALPSRH